MPGMDGIECYRELSRIHDVPRVILASGYSENALGRKYADVGFAGFLQKPFRLTNLRAKLDSAWAQRTTIG